MLNTVLTPWLAGHLGCVWRRNNLNNGMCTGVSFFAPFPSNTSPGKEKGYKSRFRSQQFFLSKICKKCFNQIYRDLYGDAILEPIWMGSNKVAGNQQTCHYTARLPTPKCIGDETERISRSKFMYCEPKYDKTVGTWSLTLVEPG